jgi:hypothetical protein
MRPLDRTNPLITIAAPSTQAEFPHMLKQRNYATAGPAEFSPSHVSIKVVRHNDDVQQSCAQIFPTLSQSSRQQVCQQESEWNKHVIVASVAGLETHLAKLDSDIRAAAPAHDSVHAVMGHIHDHAGMLRQTAQLFARMSQTGQHGACMPHQTGPERGWTQPECGALEQAQAIGIEVLDPSWSPLLADIQIALGEARWAAGDRAGAAALAGQAAAIHARTGLVTFHGPVGISQWNAFNVGWLRRVLFGGEAVIFENDKSFDKDEKTSKRRRIASIACRRGPESLFVSSSR